MRSYKIELLRFGTNAGAFQDRYLVAAEDLPAREVRLSDAGFDHEQILNALNAMRYRASPDPRGTEESLGLLRRVVADFLGKLPAFSEPTQVEIVTDNVELWLLPFEFARDGSGHDLLSDQEPGVVLTRRIRGSFAETAQPWPERPRVLFAWHGDVDHDPHRQALCEALEPWIRPLHAERLHGEMIPDARPVLTELMSASVEDIRQACARAAEEKRPYTHIHLLAHGAQIASSLGGLASFGVALKGGTVEPKALAAAVRAGKLLGPTVITLAVCDSSNASNSTMSGGRLAYELHAQGVPVVVGSQFPLTEPGAAVFARVFYRCILEGTCDVRRALLDARAAVRSSGLEGHDWASLTAHVRLPEGYSDQLRSAGVRTLMTQLDTASRWAQRIVEDKVEVSPENAQDIEKRLQKQIAAVQLHVDTNPRAPAAETLEVLGILASAHKRRAELVFSSGESGARERSWPMLQAARACYGKAYDRALSHHWTGTQYLALCAVTDGTIPRASSVQWLASMYAAEREASESIPTGDNETRERVCWALGSIVELCLLRPKLEVPVGDPPAPGRAREALEKLVRLAREEPVLSNTIDSTWRQLRRYVYWWTRANGYFGQGEDLAARASELLPLVEPHR